MAMASSASVAVGGRGRGGRIRALTKSRSTNGIAKIPKKATIPALKGTEGNNSETRAILLRILPSKGSSDQKMESVRRIGASVEGIRARLTVPSKQFFLTAPQEPPNPRIRATNLSFLHRQLHQLQRRRRKEAFLATTSGQELAAYKADPRVRAEEQQAQNRDRWLKNRLMTRERLSLLDFIFGGQVAAARSGISRWKTIGRPSVSTLH
ncbi:hypothetical protein GBA52_015445 [Prunus armeniaca]|nr:hypothetical protein GBA52_015445 [Prunus armeniaca]